MGSPVEDLDSLKSNPLVLRVYNQYTRLKQDANRYVGLCPLHAEKSGSFIVYAKDMLWTCYGGCGTGNVFQLVQEKDGCSFKEAVEKVRQAVGDTDWKKSAEAVDQVFKPVQQEAKTYKTYTLQEYSRYEAALPKSQAALDFLARRGITLDTAKLMHFGFRQDVGRLAGKKNMDIADKGWLSMPRIVDGVVVGIHYRTVVDGRKAFCRQPGMATALDGVDDIDVFEPVFVVEGEMDRAILAQAGYRAVSIPSASTTITPQMKDQIMSAGMVILAGDNDGAVGTEKMEKLWRELQERTYLLRWPDGFKDANEYFLKKCDGDVSIFQTEVDALTNRAKAEVIPDVYSIQEVMMSGQGTEIAEHPNRLRFPWTSVDKMANLLPGSVLALYATSTGMGKTQFSVQTTMFGARKHGEVVLNCQGELSPAEVATIVTAQTLKKDRNFLTKKEMDEAARLLAGVRYYIGNPAVSDPNEFLDFCEMAIRRLSVTVWVIDTFHHYFHSENNTVNVQEACSKRIKAIAQKYGLKVISVGQPRKAQQAARGKRTHISDARGAASYTDAADTVFAMHRDLARSDDDLPLKDIYESKTTIVAQKTRSKGTGSAEVSLQFFGQWASFEDITTAYDEPIAHE